MEANGRNTSNTPCLCEGRGNADSGRNRGKGYAYMAFHPRVEERPREMSMWVLILMIHASEVHLYGFVWTAGCPSHKHATGQKAGVSMEDPDVWVIPPLLPSSVLTNY